MRIFYACCVITAIKEAIKSFQQYAGIMPACPGALVNNVPSLCDPCAILVSK